MITDNRGNQSVSFSICVPPDSLDVEFSWIIPNSEPLNEKSWIGLYVHDSKDKKKYLDYIYVKDKRTGKHTFTAPCEGCFELRYYGSSGYICLRATSRPFYVGPEVKLEANYLGDSPRKIIVNWDRAHETKGPKTDWIGLFSASESDNSKCLQRLYTSDARGGNLVFECSKPDTYECRYFFLGSTAKGSYVFSGRSNTIVYPRNDDIDKIEFGITKAEAVLDYFGEDEKFSFRKGDMIKICLVGSGVKWFGECNGRSGWFPSSSVKVKVDSSIHPSSFVKRISNSRSHGEKSGTPEEESRWKAEILNNRVMISDWGQIVVDLGAGRKALHPCLSYKDNGEDYLVFFNSEFGTLLDVVRSALNAFIETHKNVLERYQKELRSYADSSERNGSLVCDSACLQTSIMNVANMHSLTNSEIVDYAKRFGTICHNLQTCTHRFRKEIKSDSTIAAFIIDKGFCQAGRIRIAPGNFYNRVERFLSGISNSKADTLVRLRALRMYLEQFNCLSEFEGSPDEKIDYSFILHRVLHYLTQHERRIGENDLKTVRFLVEMKRLIAKLMLDHCFPDQTNFPLLLDVPINFCKVVTQTEDMSKYYIYRWELDGYLSCVRVMIVNMAKNIRGEVSQDDLTDRSLAVLGSIANNGSVEGEKEIAEKIKLCADEVDCLNKKGSELLSKLDLELSRIVCEIIPAFDKVKQCFSGMRTVDVTSDEVADLSNFCGGEQEHSRSRMSQSAMQSTFGCRCSFKNGISQNATQSTFPSRCSQQSCPPLKRELQERKVDEVDSDNVIQLGKCFLEYQRQKDLLSFWEGTRDKCGTDMDFFNRFVETLQFYFSLQNHSFESPSVVGVVIRRKTHSSGKTIRGTIFTVEDIMKPENDDEDQQDPIDESSAATSATGTATTTTTTTTTTQTKDGDPMREGDDVDDDDDLTIVEP